MWFIFTINLSRQKYHKEINIYQKKNFQFFLGDTNIEHFLYSRFGTLF